MKYFSYILLLAILAALFFCPAAFSDDTCWIEISPGLEKANFALDTAINDSAITIIRIDVRNWRLKFLSISETGDTKGLSAREWCEKYDLTAAINGGMFDTDLIRHIGYMKSGDHINSSYPNKYESILACHPNNPNLPDFHIFDLDETVFDSIIADYDCIMQNLRLIKRPRENRWKPQERRWIEASLGEDSLGRALWIFCAQPVSMYKFNERLLSLPIGIVAAQHLEGGLQAQMYLKYKELKINLSGGLGAGFTDDDNSISWPIPNVIGLVPRNK